MFRMIMACGFAAMAVGTVFAAEVPKKKMAAIDTKRPGRYIASLWQYELEIAQPGASGQSRVGRLAYAEHRAAAAEINDYHDTPWGPIYWVGNVSGPGDHGWMPQPAQGVERKGRLLPLPGNGPKLLEINEANNGKSVKAVAGARLFVRLHGNPTTGYQWQLAEKLPPVLETLGEPTYVTDRQSPAAVGVGGTITFSFRAVKSGSATVRLACRRPWEKDKPPVQTFSVTVEVAQPSSPGREHGVRP